ncbi:MAG: AAA family ATPase [Candidatus Micrarchaeota archaeon]|nr:AAA family ATPase [Candidatus Micrarchaeota archaeon]
MPKKEGILVIAVTGTPGVGKTRFAGELSKAIGVKAVEVNDVVEGEKLFTGIDESGSKIVKMQELKKELKAIEVRASKSGDKAIILVGHLLADLKLEYDTSIVIRASLRELVSRLEERGYQKEKVRENLVSESIDYCGAQISGRSKEIYEAEDADQKAIVVSYLKALVSGKHPEKPNLPSINKMEEMLELVYEGNSYGL